MISWLLLSYTLPTEPTALRVGIWRKLRRTGAVLLQDATWVLPATPRTREQFQWLASEIAELGGEALFWQASLVMGMPEERLIRQFQEQVDAGYQALLTQLHAGRNDLPSISREFQHLLGRDYFHCESAQQVRQAILAARGRKA